MASAAEVREGMSRQITPSLLRGMPLPDYSRATHKGVRGKLLIVGGSRQLPGAPILAARAALRSGCGTVRVAAPECVAGHLGVAFPEVMVIPLPQTDRGTIADQALPLIEAHYDPCDAVVVGPGLGQHDETDEVARRVVERAPRPLVVDAEALLALAPLHGRVEQALGPRIYTPQPAEMGALVSIAPEAIAERRDIVAATFARDAKCVLVLKGDETVIATPAGERYLNTAGTRALGTAGSGDALSGMIGSLLAQAMEPAPAAVWGVYLHALAGEAAAREMGDDGLLASDFIERLPAVLRSLRRRTA